MIVKCDKCKTNNEIQLPDWGVVNTSTCGFCGHVMQFIPIKGLEPLEEITDTDRLNFLLNFMTADDVGDDRLIWGPVVQGESLEETLYNQSFADTAKQETLSINKGGDYIDPKEGWEKRVVLAAIDEAIRKEREK